MDDCSSDTATWEKLLELLKSPTKETITLLYLGHDGLVEEDNKRMKQVLNGLPNLTKIHDLAINIADGDPYCYYYVGYDVEKMIGEMNLNIKCIAIS